MKTNSLMYKTPEQQDDCIQSMSINELKSSFMGKPVFTRKPDNNLPITDEYTEADRDILNLQIHELRNFVNSAKQPPQPPVVGGDTNKGR